MMLPGGAFGGYLGREGSSARGKGGTGVSQEALSSVGLSLQVAVLATVLNALLGIPLAYLLAKRRFWGRAVLDVAVTLPLVLPPTVTGYYLIVVARPEGLARSASL